MVLGCAGVTLVLATPSAFSWLALSDRFAVATGEAERALLLAAGEAILASDLWHGSGALMGGPLMQTATLLMSVVMKFEWRASRPRVRVLDAPHPRGEIVDLRAGHIPDVTQWSSTRSM
jgi:hypothetical protein